MKKSLFAVLTIIAIFVCSFMPASAQILNPRPVSPNSQTICLEDNQLVSIAGGDWLDGACAFLWGASAGYGAAVRLGARAVPGLGTALLIADGACLVRYILS